MFWIAAAAVAVLVVNHFWDRIVQWASTTLADAVGQLLGAEARDLLLRALVEADKLVVGARSAAAALWGKVKATVLKALIELERLTGSRFVKRLVTYLAKNLEGEKRFVRVVQEEQVAWDDLPDDARENFLRGRKVDAADLQLPATLHH
jgi:hypothetical protein